MRLTLDSQHFSVEPQRRQKSKVMFSFCSIVIISILIVNNLRLFQSVECKLFNLIATQMIQIFNFLTNEMQINWVNVAYPQEY